MCGLLRFIQYTNELVKSLLRHLCSTKQKSRRITLAKDILARMSAQDWSERQDRSIALTFFLQYCCNVSIDSSMAHPNAKEAFVKRCFRMGVILLDSFREIHTRSFGLYQCASGYCHNCDF